MTGFYSAYKAVFDAVKKALLYVPAVPEVPAVPAHDGIPEVPAVPAVPASGVASLKTVVLGEQFTPGGLPKAVINAEPAPGAPETQDGMLVVKVRISVALAVLEYAPKDWFTDVISVMGDVVDAILADRTLGGKANDCVPTLFAPGEITLTGKERSSAGAAVLAAEVKNKVLYGGIVGFEAEMFYAP